MTHDTVVIFNVVITVCFDMPVDLASVAWKTYGMYSPESFAAVQIRIANPQSTALVFCSKDNAVTSRPRSKKSQPRAPQVAKAVIAGTCSENAAFVAVQTLFLILKEIEPKIRIKSQTIQNIVCSASLGRCVKMDELAKLYALSGTYEPENFPGMCFRLQQPKMTVLLFVRGKVVLIGGRSREDVALAWKVVRGCTGPHLTDDLFHADIVRKHIADRITDEDVLEEIVEKEMNRLLKINN